MNFRILRIAAPAALAVAFAAPALAGVTEQEAQALKSTLTPLGAEKAGNKEGTIPAWTGGGTQPTPGYRAGGRRPDPFAADKPVLSITQKNMAEHADKLSDGSKAMLRKYPDYRIDVYPTRRTAAAPQWVYDNTYRNATRAKLNGAALEGAYGGIPFPIPKSGAEAMWNHLLRWRGTSFEQNARGYQVTSEGKVVLASDVVSYTQMPYYFQDAAAQFTGEFWTFRMSTNEPAIRAGEAILGREHVDHDKTQAWVYLTGQRRVRKLPLLCCDTPTAAAAGLMSVDEIDGWSGRLTQFDWKLVGKQEMYIPYNTNKTLQPAKDTDIIGKGFLNPDHVRWELHRVWVVEAALRSGARHQVARSRYYLDEDTWYVVQSDRWDANGQLWKAVWTLPLTMPDIPATATNMFGFYDLLAGTMFVANVQNEKNVHYKLVPRLPDAEFTPDAMAAGGMR